MSQQTDLRRIPTAGKFAGALLIAVVAFVAYWPSLRGEFIYEDAALLSDNPLIHAPDGFYRVWFSSDQPDYVPLTSTTFWFEWRFWGTNSTGYHVTNLLLHIAACLLLWTLLRTLDIPGALLAALLFAIHPVNVESVAWIEQRKDTLSTLFFLLSILWYLRADGYGRWYWLSLIAFALAMFSKGSVATLPVALLLIVWWQKKRLTVAELVRSAPFFLVSAVLTPVVIWFVAHGTGEVVRDVTFTQRLLQAGTVVWFYLAKALVPIQLIFFYPLWNIQSNNLLWWLPLAAAAAVTLLLLWQLRSVHANWIRPLWFAWLFFCVALAPAMGFFDPGYMKFSLVADHYQHLALLSVVSLIAAGITVWYQRIQKPLRWTVASTAVALLLASTGLTWQQCHLYDNDIHLYEVTLQENPNSWMAHLNLGNSLAAAGHKPEALEHFQQAIRLKPDYVVAYNSMGRLLCDVGRPNEGIQFYQQALRLNPDYALTYYNLGIELAKLGQPDAAIEHFRQALQIRSDFPAARINLGNALLQTGHPDDALQQFRQALEINPNFVMAHFNLANTLASAGRLDEAIEHFRDALRLRPDYPDAHYNLGIVLAKKGNMQEAILEFEKTVELEPNVAVAHNNLGNTLLSVGRGDEAILQYREALRLDPQDAASYINLANALAELKRTADAIATAQQALEMARSRGDQALVQQFETWLSNHPAQQNSSSSSVNTNAATQAKQ